MSTAYTTARVLPLGDANGTTITLATERTDGIDTGAVRVEVAEDQGTDRVEAYLDRDTTITLALELIRAAGGLRLDERLGVLRQHDTALRNLRAAVTTAAAMASEDTLAEAFVTGYRGHSLSGHRDRAEAYTIAGLIRGDDHGLAALLEEQRAALIRVERQPGAEATVTVHPTA